MKSIILSALLVIGFSGISYSQEKAILLSCNEENQKNCIDHKDKKDKGGDIFMCTMEAKLCPDGSYVSRQGHNCEFAPCPDKPLRKDNKSKN